MNAMSKVTTGRSVQCAHPPTEFCTLVHSHHKQPSADTM